MKVVKTTFYQKFVGPIHLVDNNFELQRRNCIIDTLDNFIVDWKDTDFSTLEAGETLTVEVLEMDKAKFEKLKKFDLPSR